ncbi:hypothetical protein [Bradyrhizobium sp. RT6a]|uniref:hypothetical protein n=1 Tax=unclassified Bradyrhizobium TaxID=2631580 RepID=UPI003398E6EC
MDLQKILDQKIKDLPVGPHIIGLKAVMAHIDAAIKHYKRGQAEPDQTLFTDVVFRCNQAFEGSIKEAYRVLAGKDPSRIAPHKIEEFLGEADLLRKKVLDQFTRYRTEWRNPSTHDYTLDFDEDEGLMAIVSVTVFAIVLCDQIDGKLAFDTAADPRTLAATPTTRQGTPLLDLVTNALLRFAQGHTEDPLISLDHLRQHYLRTIGTIAGYLVSALRGVPGVSVKQSQVFSDREADIVVERSTGVSSTEKVIVELKISSSGKPKSLPRRFLQRSAVEKASFFLHLPDVTGAVVFLYSGSDKTYSIADTTEAPIEKMRIVGPVSDTRLERLRD